MEGLVDTNIFSSVLWRLTACVLGACAQFLCSSCATSVTAEALGLLFLIIFAPANLQG